MFTFGASILWILVISTTLLYLEYRLNERAVIQNIQEVGKSNSASISRSVWEFERALLKTQLKAIVQLPSVSYICLDETDGTISEFGNKSRRYPKKITFNIDFVDRGEIIRLGLLTIYPDLESLNKNLISLALKIFSVQTVNAFVVVIIIFVLFYLFAGRHLTDIAAQAGGLSADHLECPIALNRRPKSNKHDDELDTLETALNDMRTHLINAFSELKTSEERHRKLFETMRQGVIYQESGGHILSANPAASQILGIDENRLASMTSYDSHWVLAREDGSPIPPGDQPGMIALKTGKAVMGEVLSVYNPRLKERRWLRVNAVPLIRNGETTPYQVHLTFDDITRWKKSRELINRYVQIISSTNDLMSFVDDLYIYRAVNDSYLKYHNKKCDEIIGFSIPDLMGTEVFESVVKPNFDRAMGGENINFQAWFDYPKMGRRYMSVTYSPFYEKKDIVNGVVVSAHDMTGIKLAEFEIRDLRNYLSNIIDSMPSQIIGVDQDGLVTQWNMTIAVKTGITSKSAVGKALIDLIPKMAPEMEKVAQSIRTGRAVHDPKRRCLLNDEKRFEEMTIYPLIANGVSGAVIRIDDVTEKIQMEEMMIQSEKMLSVGGLAAGMAHEIN
ncbi:MAG: PAS domain S-box protein, partial [Desulfobacterales bacterium]|nr:PAS domain S-box protein [Desulfobacterales bacterium]